MRLFEGLRENVEADISFGGEGGIPLCHLVSGASVSWCIESQGFADCGLAASPKALLISCSILDP